MKGFNFISPFLISCVILSSLSSSSSEVPANALGIAWCNVWAQKKLTCQVEDMIVDSFPPECTAFCYEGLDITDLTAVELNAGKIPEGYLDSLKRLNKPVIVKLTRKSWPKAIANVEQDGAATEVATLKTYLEQHTVVSGFALYGTELYPSKDAPDTEYTQKLITYIGILKKNFPKLKIGLYLFSGIILSTLDTPLLKSLDLTRLNDYVDFIRIETSSNYYFDECESANYTHGDVLLNSFNKLIVGYLNGFKLSKEKIIWDVWGIPSNMKMTDCDLTYPNMCLDTIGTYCADTQQMLYKRAQYYNEIAGGIALNYIDLDDVNQVCNCSRKFPVFYAVWDGFNGNPLPKECFLFDRPNK